MRIFKLLYLSYLRYFAKKALAKHRLTIIGIAGSVGKSGTARALFAVLALHGETKLVGNSETGIPLGILGLQPTDYTVADWIRLLLSAPKGVNHLKNTKYLIVEMGIDDPYPPKNMEYLLTILKPDIAVVLNESATHAGQFEKTLSQEQLAKTEEEKVKLLIQNITEEDCKIITESDCKIGIYNADDENVLAAIKQSSKKTILLPFGKEKSNAISYKKYEITTSGSSFSFTATTQHDNEILLKLPGLVLPREYEQTFASVIAVAGALDIPKDTVIKGLQSFSLPAGRATLLTGINNAKIIDSSYNASKSAVIAFLEMMRELKKQTKRPIAFVFGDMRELGDEAKIEHEAVAQKLRGIVDYLYLVGPLTREFVLPHVDLHTTDVALNDSDESKKKENNTTIKQNNNSELKEVRWFANAKYAGEYLKDNLPKNSLVLVKGSQNTIFLEETIKYILANKDDVKKLTRQSSFWMKTKNTTLSLRS